MVTVQAVYPGASAEVLEKTVASPIENAINGVPNMIYMSSTPRRSNGVVQIQVTFEIGTRIDDAVGQRQQPRQAGRAAAAGGSAPAGRDRRARQLVVPAGARVLRAGRPLRRPLHLELRDAQRARPAEAAAGHDQRADLRRQGLRDADLGEARPPRAAEADAGRRRPRDQRAERAVRRGQGRPGADHQGPGPRLHDHDAGPARPTPRSSARSSCAPIPTARPCACPTSRASSWARRTTTSSAATTASRRRWSASSCSRAPTRSRSRRACARRWPSSPTRFPEGLTYAIPYDTTRFVEVSIREVAVHAGRGDDPGVPRRLPVPAELARDDHPAGRRAGVAARRVRRPVPARLLDQHADAVRHGAGDRHRRRRRDRRAGKRRADHARGQRASRARRRSRRCTR